MSDTARVRVPATSANVGPGFDCLGVALRVYNTVTVQRGGEHAPDGMIDEAAAAFFAQAKTARFPFAWTIEGEVPRSRGLGSSVTVRLGILHGLNQLAGSPLAATGIYHLCASLEGHPDNAAPAAFGGFTIARPDGSYQRFRVSRTLKFILLIPDFEVRTADARKVLPSTIDFPLAVRTSANAASVAAAFASRNYASLRGCFEDFLHQPYRAPLIPGFETIVEAAVSAGAIGGWISGSGSTIAAITENDAGPVAEAMRSAGGYTHALITTANNKGVKILE